MRTKCAAPDHHRAAGRGAGGAPRVDIKEARATLARIEDTTWGLELPQIDGERFVVLPAGTLDNPPWTVGGRPALKLSGDLKTLAETLRGRSTDRTC